jgi:tRNA pseudouridine32 synthase/23S rRNA pseudouridine746 synthase
MALGAFPGGPPCAPPGRPAQTLLRVLARGTFQGRAATRLSLTPLSGRRHQLRLHCAAIGHPIVGDATYGGGDAPRMCLAAARLEVELEWLRALPARSQRAARGWAEARARAASPPGAPLQPLVGHAGDPFEALRGWAVDAEGGPRGS